jgi:hypothetical protein
MPLSILTAPVIDGRVRPYDDAVGSDGLLEYRYRGPDINHRDNSGLREAMRRQAPLIYFMGIIPGRYVAAYPGAICRLKRDELLDAAHIIGDSEEQGAPVRSATP